MPGRKILVTAVLVPAMASLGLIGTTGTAMAAGSPVTPTKTATRHATMSPVQSAAVLQAEIRAQLAYNSSGTVINDHQVSYDNGHIIVTVPMPGAVPQFAGGCQKGWFCIFSGTDYTVYEAQVQYPLDTNIPVAQYLPGKIGSLSNARRTGSILSNGRGATACYPGGAHTTAVGSPINAYPFIYLERSANCN